jgi:hypothetical protein
MLIDWLYSETVAIPFLLQFFKLLQTNLEQLPRIFESIGKLTQSATKITKKPIEFNEPEQIVATFEINELHGNELVKKSYPICTRVNFYCSCKYSCLGEHIDHSIVINLQQNFYTK